MPHVESKLTWDICLTELIKIRYWRRCQLSMMIKHFKIINNLVQDALFSEKIKFEANIKKNVKINIKSKK